MACIISLRDIQSIPVMWSLVELHRSLVLIRSAPELSGFTLDVAAVSPLLGRHSHLASTVCIVFNYTHLLGY